MTLYYQVIIIDYPKMVGFAFSQRIEKHGVTLKIPLRDLNWLFLEKF